MNRFRDLVNDLKQRSENDEVLKRLLPELEAIEVLEAADREEQSGHHFRLPYSSDPKPVDDAWA